MLNAKVTIRSNSELTVDGDIRFRRGASRSKFAMAYPYDSTVSAAIKRAGLPKSHKVHWSEQRKADVVRAVRDKLITFDEARWRYLLSRSEFRTWEEKVEQQEAKEHA